ncbi:MAG TPA: hypothetical protein VE935_06690 [Burkholderiales bacterium]|jgi:hypothetical protein|nr:hypothetical protein [Burkholderiales bacterium]
MNRLYFGVAALALAGCVDFPQNAQQFREQVPGATFGQKQTFEAKRPLREVAKTFQAKAPECLNVSVRTISQTSTSYQNILTTYKPTVLVSAQKAELHVQRHYQGGGVIIPGKEPEGGLYMLVADATPIDRSRTRIDIYAPTHGADTMIRAVTGWATGENVGCPDLTKN